MLRQAEAIQPRLDFGGINRGRAASIGQHQHQRHKTLYDCGIAVGGKAQQVAFTAGVQPHLAGTTAHLVGVGLQGRVHRRQGLAQRDDQPIAVVPIVEGFEFRLDIIESGDCHDRSP